METTYIEPVLQDTTKQYITKINDEWITVPRPDWYNEDKTPVSDELLAENGYFVLVDDNAPEFDQKLKHLNTKPKETWVLENGRVHPQYELIDKTLDDVKAEGLRAINSCYENGASQFSDKYTESELLTWHLQRTEVENWLADDTNPTPFIDAIAEGMDESREEVIASIITKTDEYLASGKLLGYTQKTRTALLSATTVDEAIAIYTSYHFTNVG